MSKDIERFYRRLPVSLQHAACSVVGLHTEVTRYGRPFSDLLDDASGRTFWSEERIVAFRDERLRLFVEHAVQTTSFYPQALKSAGADSRDITSLADLKALPILTKAQVQENGPGLVSSAIPARGRRLIHTSGTTGSGLHLWTMRQAIQEQWATWWRYRAWHGIERKAWCALFGGRSIVPAHQTRPPFWRYNVPGRQLLFSAYHLSPSTLPAYVKELRKHRPPWLHGYPSLLAVLANYLTENRTDLGYPIRWVTGGAENLLPQQSASIERAFGVRPRQHYGMAEAIGNISECDRGRLHVDEDFAALEFLPIGGQQFRVVGTNFTNLATPLLRYDVLDVVTIENDARCDCGRPSRVVSSIDGREEDYLVLNDGSRLGATLNHVFKDMLRVREAQIRQRQPGKLTLAVVRGRGYFEEDERKLLDEMRKRVGDRAEISIEYVDSLPRTRTGKLRFVVSEVGREP